MLTLIPATEASDVLSQYGLTPARRRLSAVAESGSMSNVTNPTTGKALRVTVYTYSI